MMIAESTSMDVGSTGGPVTTARDPQAEPTDVLSLYAGSYRLTRLVARGGSGEVYQAVGGNGERYAVKVLLPSVASDEVRLLRFYQEANALLSVRHDNVLCCYEVAQAEGRHYLVTEWLEGANLATWVHQVGLFSQRRALKVIAQVAGGLAAVHQRGLLHRDVCPNNIVMTVQGQIKLIDFEFSKDAVADLALTAEGVGLGRADYVSPEQLQCAKRVDERTDIYALGATLYAILTNRMPFPGQTYQQKWEAKCNDVYIPPNRLAPHLSDEVQAFIGRLMVADPAKRIPTAAQVAQEAHELRNRLKVTSRRVEEVEQLKALMWRVTAMLPSGDLLTLEAFELEVADMIRRGEIPLSAQAARGGKPPYRAISQIPEFKAAVKAVTGSPSFNDLTQNGREGCSTLLKQVGGALTTLGKSMSGSYRR